MLTEKGVIGNGLDAPDVRGLKSVAVFFHLNSYVIERYERSPEGRSKI